MCKYCIIILVFTFIGVTLFSQTAVSYSFIAAGHAYGSHNGDNMGLHPAFLNSIANDLDSNVEFFVFTGDIINHSTEEAWQQFENEIKAFNLPYYCVMGNHDNNAIAHAYYDKNYGNDYYAFDHKMDRYIILNSTEQDRSISNNQLDFLTTQLGIETEVNNVFIFMHEVIWNSHEKYKDTRSNSRSRYDQMKNLSNYWEEVHPLLEQHADKNIYVISGDVAGNADAIPAFYDKWDHITLISSGMGEVEDENYLQVDVLENGLVEFKLVALRTEDETEDLVWYAVPNAPEKIEGANQITDINVAYEYQCTFVNNADEYIWTLPENTRGTSTTNNIELFFEQRFTTGDIAVASFHDGFGYSEAISFNVSSDFTSTIEQNKVQNIRIRTCGEWLFIESEKDKQVLALIYDLQGRLISTNELVLRSGQIQRLSVNQVNNEIILVKIISNNTITTKKVFVF